MIDHDDAWALLPEAATDTLPDEAASQLNAHLEGCALCAAELESLRAVSAQLMYATPLEPVNPAVRDRIRARLEARATADAAAGAVRHPGGDTGRSVFPRRRSRAGLLALAASIALVGSVVALGWAMRDRAALRSRISALEGSAAAEQRAASSRVDSLQRLVATVTAPSVTTIHLTAAGTRPADAAVYWNRGTGVVTLVAHGLPRATPGRGYQLWVLTDAAPVSGGMVVPDDRGDAASSVDSPAAAAAVRGFALTEEPASGSPQPTTQPFLAGRVPARN